MRSRLLVFGPGHQLNIALFFLLERFHHFCPDKSQNGLHAIPIQIVLITHLRLRVDQCSEASFLTFFMT